MKEEKQCTCACHNEGTYRQEKGVFSTHHKSQCKCHNPENKSEAPTPIEDWVQELRDLYLDKSPDEFGFVTKSITFNWGSFQFTPKIKNTEFYLVTKNSLEDFIRQQKEISYNKGKQDGIQQGIQEIWDKLELGHPDTDLNSYGWIVNVFKNLAKEKSISLNTNKE